MKGLGKIIALILSFLGLSSKATANKKAKVKKIDKQVKKIKVAKKTVNKKMSKVKKEQKKVAKPRKRKKIKDAESFLKDFAKKWTLTQEQADNIAKNIQELQIKSDSLTVSDSLKTSEIGLLNEKLSLTEKELELANQKTKLVKPSWYENKWLYFGYGTVLSYAIITLVNQADNIINIF